MSRICSYTSQVEGQQKEVPQPVIIEEEEEWKVEKILNKRKVQEKDKYLVRWKGFTVEGDTWESRENLENAKELVEEFEKEYEGEKQEIRKQEKIEENRDYWRKELPGQYTARKLFGWSDGEYNRKYWKKLDKR